MRTARWTFIRPTAQVLNHRRGGKDDSVFGNGECYLRVMPLGALGVRQPIGKLPSVVEQRLKEVPTVLVRGTGKGEVADVIGPSFQISSLRCWFSGSPR